MRVFVTGATGFVGFHTVMALLAAGHRVRLGVRNVAKMQALYAPFKVDVSDYAVGEITDPVAINEALVGCDAVVHTAAMVSLDPSRAEQMYRTNVEGTHNVIGGALSRGIRSIIHVSSAAALYNPDARVIDETLLPAEASSAYAASKVAAERYGRALVEKGESVAITYPTGVIGPNDPAMSEGNQGLKIFFDAGLIRTSSGMQIIDVRELAEVHVRLLEGGYSGPWVVGGHYLEWRALNALVQRLVGRPMTEYVLPGWSLRLAGRMVDVYSHWRPVDMPFTSEAMAYATRWVYVDDSKLRKALQFSYRPLAETLGETILWLGESGHIDRHWIEQLTAQD